MKQAEEAFKLLKTFRKILDKVENKKTRKNFEELKELINKSEENLKLLTKASARAITPTRSARRVTKDEFPGTTPSSINFLKSSGVETTNSASITTVMRNSKSEFLYGNAYRAIRLTVPGFSFWSFTDWS